MLLNHTLDLRDLYRILQAFKVALFLITADMKITIAVKYISDAARHPTGEVSSSFTENNDPTARHILTTVIPHSFDDSANSTIPHTEPLTSHATDVGFTIGRAIEGNIADNDVFLRLECRFFRRINNQFAATESFTKIVIRVTLKTERNARRCKRTKGLARRPFKMNIYSIFGKSLGTMASSKFAAHNCTDNPIGILNR